MPHKEPIDKALFAAGAQCAKRLYLDYRRRGKAARPDPEQDAMARAGAQVTELARSVFVGATDLGPLPIDEAVDRASAAMQSGVPSILFGAAFRTPDIELRTDILMSDGRGTAEVFEVKSGTRVKSRHIKDLALQIAVIERCGHTVGAATVLHPDPHYEHAGRDSYPVQELLKHVDVTDKVRRYTDRVDSQIASLLTQLEDPGTLELPTGTWCHAPVPCPHFAACRVEHTGQPLVDLPGLTHDQETQLRQRGIEDLTQLDPESEDLDEGQRRALRAVRAGDLTIDSKALDEVRDVRHPIHFVTCATSLTVLPRFGGMKPWQHLPFAWACAAMQEDGSIEVSSFAVAGPEDPRAEFVRTLSDTVRPARAMVRFGTELIARLRELLDHDPELKPSIRAVLHADALDLRRVMRYGAYHPDQRGRFSLEAVHGALCQPRGDIDLPTSAHAAHAFDRLLNTRTRAATRAKLREQIREHVEHRAHCLIDIYRRLCEATPAQHA